MCIAQIARGFHIPGFVKYDHISSSPKTPTESTLLGVSSGTFLEIFVLQIISRVKVLFFRLRWLSP